MLTPGCLDTTPELLSGIEIQLPLTSVIEGDLASFEASGKKPDGGHVLKLRFFGKTSRLRRGAILEFSAMKLLPNYSVF